MTVGSEVWCVGGIVSTDGHNCVDVYSADTNAWRRGGELPDGWRFQTYRNSAVSFPKPC